LENECFISDSYNYPPASDGSYEYPPVVDELPSNDDELPSNPRGRPATVFYCIQEDLNTTLVNQTLDAEGFGVCNISGELVTCPIEIECKIEEADNCCEGKLLTFFFRLYVSISR
jgi:hypothetical protein